MITPADIENKEFSKSHRGYDEQEVDEYLDSRLPAIIPIPGKDGNQGIGMTSLKKSVERAVGADILFGGDN